MQKQGNKNVKKIRESLLLTQCEFAELIGVSRQIVSSWENGKYSISPEHWNKILNLVKKLD